MRAHYESPASIKPHFLAFPVLLVLRTVRHVKSQPFPFLTPHAAYICAQSPMFITPFCSSHPRYIYAWLFFSVCSVNPSVPHTHTAYICGHSSQSVALFPPIPHSICVSLLSHRQRIKYTLALLPSRIRSGVDEFQIFGMQIKAFCLPYLQPTLHTSACSSAYCCVFINVRNTLSYISILPSHL